MNGSSLVKAFVPLAGGAQAVYNASGLQYYRHPDWLGSSRLATTPSRTVYYDGAYAPFGENYSQTGTQDLSFTGQNQDAESSGASGVGGLYDFLYRKQSPVQGRWLSPDPAGLAAANPSDPQSWNRYAYVGNRSLSSTDPLGLLEMPCDPWSLWCPGDPNPGPCNVSDPSCGGPCYPTVSLCIPDPPGGLGGGGGGGGGYAAGTQRSGGRWPGNETTGLSPIPNTQPLNLGNLLSFAPGLGCSDGSGLGFTTSTPVSGNNPCIVLAITIALAIESVAENSSGNNSNDKPDASCAAQTLAGAALFDWCADQGWVTVAGFACNGNYTCCQTKRSAFDAGCLGRNSYYDKKAGVQRYVPIDQNLLQSVDAVCCQKWK